MSTSQDKASLNSSLGFSGNADPLVEKKRKEFRMRLDSIIISNTEEEQYNLKADHLEEPKKESKQRERVNKKQSGFGMSMDSRQHQFPMQGSIMSSNNMRNSND